MYPYIDQIKLINEKCTVQFNENAAKILNKPFFFELEREY